MKPISFHDRVAGTVIMRYDHRVESARMKFAIVETASTSGDIAKVFRVYYTTLLNSQLIWVRRECSGHILSFHDVETFELTPEEVNAILIEEI